MENQKSFRDRHPAPWQVNELPGGYEVRCVRSDTRLAVVYGKSHSSSPGLTWGEAKALASAITGLVLLPKIAGKRSNNPPGPSRIPAQFSLSEQGEGSGVAGDTEEEDDPGVDVALTPGPGADSGDEVDRWVDKDIRELYEVYSYRHAASILKNSHTTEFDEIMGALRTFRLSKDDIRAPGGNESTIVKRVTQLLRPQKWLETRISADLKVKKISKFTEERTTKTGRVVQEPRKTEETVDITNFVDGHKVDFVKGSVAFDLEWNSKDQTFDRDLYAFRAFYDCSIISAGILVTRSSQLNEVFAAMGDDIKNKYGASTTWMGKLLYRLNAGRNGGCPVLVLGITPKLIEDGKEK